MVITPSYQMAASMADTSFMMTILRIRRLDINCEYSTSYAILMQEFTDTARLQQPTLWSRISSNWSRWLWNVGTGQRRSVFPLVRKLGGKFSYRRPLWRGDSNRHSSGGVGLHQTHNHAHNTSPPPSSIFHHHHHHQLLTEHSSTEIQHL